MFRSRNSTGSLGDAIKMKEEFNLSNHIADDELHTDFVKEFIVRLKENCSCFTKNCIKCRKIDKLAGEKLTV